MSAPIKKSRRMSKNNKTSQLQLAMGKVDEKFYTEMELFNELFKSAKYDTSYNKINEMMNLQQTLITKIRKCITDDSITDLDIIEHLMNYCKMLDSHYKYIEDTDLFLIEIFPDIDT